jgi:hypothetical protein
MEGRKEGLVPGAPGSVMAIALSYGREDYGKSVTSEKHVQS